MMFPANLCSLADPRKSVNLPNSLVMNRMIRTTQVVDIGRFLIKNQGVSLLSSQNYLTDCRIACIFDSL